MADDVILREQVWGFRGMPILAHPLCATTLMAEIFRATLKMNRFVTKTMVMNADVSENGIMNRVVSNKYEELEDAV